MFFAKKDRLTYFVAFILLYVMFWVSIYIAIADSGTNDEVAHVPSGYSYWRGDFRMNPEHPPLAKALDGLPLHFMHLNTPYSDWSWDGINQWESGWYFLYRAGNNPDQMLFWSRFPTILMLILLGLYVFLWARKLFGNNAAIVSLILFSFAPTLLAHGHLVTTDIAAGLAFVISLFYYDKYVKEPNKINLVWAGIALGLAQVLKFSAILLIPMIGILAITRVCLEGKKGEWRLVLWRHIKSLFWIFLLAFGVLWLVYIPFTWSTPLDIEKKLIDMSLPSADSAPLRSLLHTMAGIPILKALGHYLLGFFMVSAHAAGGHTAYILGKFSRVGWWYFFPLAYLFKQPLAEIFLLIFSFIRQGWVRFKDKVDLWNIILLLTPIVIYFIISIKSSLNIGVRHLIPTFPFIYMFIAKNITPYIENKRLWPKIVLGLLLLWYVLSSILSFPTYLAHFNELRFLIKKQKHEILVDSSLDWGQDMKRLARYVKENNIKEIKVDYFGGSVFKYPQDQSTYIPGSIEWHSQYGPTKGWIAISATFWEMSRYYKQIQNQTDYEWLDKYEPKAIVGDSILVYYIP